MGLNNDHRAAADLYGASSKYTGAKPFHSPGTTGPNPEEAARTLSAGHEQMQCDDQMSDCPGD